MLDFLQKAHDQWDVTKNDFKVLLRQLVTVAADVSNAAENIVAQVKLGEQTSILIYADYASSVSGFLKHTFDFLSNFPRLDSRLPGLKKDIAGFENIIDPALDACYDIKSQNYSALVLHSSQILEEVLGVKYSFKEGYISYGTFMAGVVEAKNLMMLKMLSRLLFFPLAVHLLKEKLISTSL